MDIWATFKHDIPFESWLVYRDSIKILFHREEKIPMQLGCISFPPKGPKGFTPEFLPLTPGVPPGCRTDWYAINSNQHLHHRAKTIHQPKQIMHYFFGLGGWKSFKFTLNKNCTKFDLPPKSENMPTQTSWTGHYNLPRFYGIFAPFFEKSFKSTIHLLLVWFLQHG